MSGHPVFRLYRECSDFSDIMIQCKERSPKTLFRDYTTVNTSLDFLQFSVSCNYEVINVNLFSFFIRGSGNSFLYGQFKLLVTCTSAHHRVSLISSLHALYTLLIQTLSLTTVSYSPDLIIYLRIKVTLSPPRNLTKTVYLLYWFLI